MVVKLILFDVGGVLDLSKISKHGGHYDIGVHHFMAKKLKMGLDVWFDAIDIVYAASMEGKLKKKKVLSTMSGNLNVGKERLEKLFIRAYKKYYKRNKKLYDIAFKLKKNGYRIAILSDQWHVSKEVLIKDEDARKFDFSIVSCDVKMKKPDPKIYRLALKKAKQRFNIKAGEIVFIDNRIWNLKPARKIGMKTILFESDRQVLKDLSKLGVRIR